jgi:hypothetical protein
MNRRKLQLGPLSIVIGGPFGLIVTFDTRLLSFSYSSHGYWYSLTSSGHRYPWLLARQRRTQVYNKCKYHITIEFMKLSIRLSSPGMRHNWHNWDKDKRIGAFGHTLLKLFN